MIEVITLPRMNASTTPLVSRAVFSMRARSRFGAKLTSQAKARRPSTSR